MFLTILTFFQTYFRRVCIVRFWNPLLKDERTSAFKEISYQANWCKLNAQFISSKQYLTLSLSDGTGAWFTIPKRNYWSEAKRAGQLVILEFKFSFGSLCFGNFMTLCMKLGLLIKWSGTPTDLWWTWLYNMWQPDKSPLWVSLLAQVDSFSLVRGVVGAKVWLLLEEIHPGNGQRLEKAMRWGRNSVI